jgi:NADH-quinone oxidoreductase subunit C
MAARLDGPAIFEGLREGLGADGEASVFGFVDVDRPAADSKDQGGVRDPYCRARPERLVEVALRCRDLPALRFDFLQCVTAVDLFKEERIDVVYHLYSYVHRHRFVLKVELPRAAPTAPSVSSVWRTAVWQEREQFDLLGVTFTGHPELRRLLMPDDWVGHPMRKDFREPAEYRGMPTTRPSPLQLLVTYDRQGRPVEAVTPASALPPKDAP